MKTSVLDSSELDRVNLGRGSKTQYVNSRLDQRYELDGQEMVT